MILGAQGIELQDLLDNCLYSLDRLDLAKQIEEPISHHQPQSVNMSYLGDVHVYCRFLHVGGVTAHQSTSGHAVPRLFSFEVACISR